MSSISDKFDQHELISNQSITNDQNLMKKDSTNTTHSQSITNTNNYLLCKCIGKSSAQKANLETSTYSTSTVSSFTTLNNNTKSTPNKQNQLILINCTSCIDLNRSNLGNNQADSDKLNKRASNTNNNNNNNASNNKKLTQFANTRSLSLVSTQITKKKKPKYTTQFSIRFHKFSLRSPSFSALTRNKLKHNRRLVHTKMNQRCCLSVSVVPFDRHNSSSNSSNNNSNNSNSKSKKNNKKSANNKQTDDEFDSYSREKPAEPVANNNIQTKMNKTNEQTHKTESNSVSQQQQQQQAISTSTPNNETSSLCEHNKSASLLNHHDFHKIDLLVSSKKSSSASINHSSPLMITPIETNITMDADMIAKQVALFKQKNICNKESSPSLTSHQSSTPVNTNNDLISINIGNTNLNLNNTISSRYQHFERRKSSASSNQNDSSSGNASANTCEEIFDFNLRVNKLRFIDDSASSTALTSPAESINHIYNFVNKTSHLPQQQHKLLNSYNFAGTSSQLSVSTSSSTSSSRTVSIAPSTSGSSASTPVSNSSFTNRQLNSTKRMLMPIQRQENVKSSTETLCSNEAEPLHKPVKHNESKQFQHELLENYRNNNNKSNSPHQQLLHQQQDNEDDEEIKNIILNNLNEKLKSGQSSINAKNQRHPKQNGHHHYQYMRNSKSKPAIISPNSSTNTEIDSSSSECDSHFKSQPRHYHFTSYKQQKLKQQQHQQKSSSFESNTSSNNTASSTAATSPQVDTTENICKSCEVRIRLNNTTNCGVSSLVAGDSNCKYCKLFLNYESSASSSKNISSPCSSIASSSTTSKQLNYQYGYSPVNRFKNKGDDRVYAYENFDCINECLEETSILNQIIDSKISLRKKNLNERKEIEEIEEVNEEEEEDEEDETTSILVEDGFIRMSSPVGDDDDDEENEKENETETEEKQNETSELNETLESKDQFKHKLVKNPTNFPNVGSSPVSEEFLNSECSSSDEEDAANINKNEPNSLINNTNELQSDSFDGIIILSSLKKKNKLKQSKNESNNELIKSNQSDYSKVTSSNKEALSLSDDEEIIVEEDDEEDDDDFKELVTPKNSKNSSALLSQEETQSSSEKNSLEHASVLSSTTTVVSKVKASTSASLAKTPPHSIMKQKQSNYTELNQIIYNRAANLEQSSSSSLMSSASLNLTSSPITSNANSNSCASNNLLLATQSLINSSNSTSGANQMSTSASQKPKVRFNLDINYEKEREWNRASKLIGDASKTQIEWTQEVEV